MKITDCSHKLRRFLSSRVCALIVWFQHQGATLAEELENVLHELEEEPMDGIKCDDPTTEAQASQTQPAPSTPVRLPLEMLPFSPSQVTLFSISLIHLTF